MKFSSDFTEATVQLLTGFPYSVVATLAAEISALDRKPIDEEDVIAALTMMHTNTSDGVLHYLLRALFPGLGEDCVRKRTLKLLKRAFPLWVCNAESRFDVVDPLFAHVTCIVDGTPVFVRGDDDDYSGHRHGKVLNFTAFVCLDGRPLHYTGPVIGRRHDAAAFHTDTMQAACTESYFSGAMFRHYQAECVGGDAGYQGCAHCFTHYKALGGNPLTDVQSGFNRWWRRIRSRIEHRFAYFDRHRFMWYCIRDHDTIALMFRIMWNAEAIMWSSSNHSCGYTDLYPARQVQRDLGPLCECNWTARPSAEHLHRIRVYRDEVAAAIHVNSGGVRPATKRPRHGSQI